MKILRDFVKKFAKKPVVNKGELEEVCLFPLPQVVLLPGSVLPLHIFEDRYKIMTEDLMKNDSILAMSLLRTLPKMGKPLPSHICGAGKINLIHEYPDGRKNIYVEGMKRVKIIKILQEKPYLKALAECLPDKPFESVLEEQKNLEELLLLTKRWVFLKKELDDEYLKYVNLFSQPHQLADFIGFNFVPLIEEKQILLETVCRKTRVDKIKNFLTAEIGQLEKIASTNIKPLVRQPGERTYLH